MMPGSASTRRLVYAAISAAILAFDLWTKKLAETTLPMHGGTIRVFDGWLSFALVHNTGAAFGLFSQQNPEVTAKVLNLVALGALVVVALYSWKTPPDRSRLQTGLALIFGGALGNFIDRLTLGYVVDFVEVYWRSFHWPNFNVADSAICVGVGLLILDSFLEVSEPAADKASEGNG